MRTHTPRRPKHPPTTRSRRVTHQTRATDPPLPEQTTAPANAPELRAESRLGRSRCERRPSQTKVQSIDLRRKEIPVAAPVSRNRLLGSLKEAGGWPGADRNTVVTLALLLATARADAEESSYFQELSEQNPADATAQALAGFFQLRSGHDVAAAVAKLDKATTVEPGLPH